jgi:hypothetical protein
MKRIALIVAAVAALTFVGAWTPSCASAPVSVTTPQGKAAFAADQVLTRIEEVENAVIAAATPDATGHVAIPKPTANLIVGFCGDAAAAIKSTPDGWLATARTAWGVIKLHIPPADLPKVQGYVISIDLLLAGAGS